MASLVSNREKVVYTRLTRCIEIPNEKFLLKSVE